MLIWITSAADNMPAWVQILILSAGVVVNFGIACLALWPHLPRRQKIAIFLRSAQQISMYGDWYLVVNNLGPKDISEVSVFDYSNRSQLFDALSVYYPSPPSGPEPLELWEQSYIQSGGSAEIDLGTLDDAETKISERALNEERDFKLKVEYSPVGDSRRTVELRLSVRPLASEIKRRYI